MAGMWGAGAMMGYGFAHRTLSKEISGLRAKMDLNEEKCRHEIDTLRAEHKTEIGGLVGRLREIENLYFYGVQRQLGQVRESTAHLIDRGRIVPPVEEGE